MLDEILRPSDAAATAPRPGRSAAHWVDVEGPPGAGAWVVQITVLQHGKYRFEHAPGFLPATRRLRATPCTGF